MDTASESTERPGVDHGCAALQEAEVSMDQSDIEPFMDMYLILEALKAEDLNPALQWAATHSAELEALGMVC